MAAVAPNAIASSPRVSVVMSVYNGECALAATMQCLLGQTFTDLEVIVVNDGSTDQSGIILKEWAQRDCRVRVIEQANHGLTHALRTGCAVARGEFIARQDVGDWSAPTRIERQVSYMDAHPEVVLNGPFVELRGPDDEFLGLMTFPVDIDEATHDWYRQKQAPLHPSAMFHRAAYERVGGYRLEFRVAQDHDLWSRLIPLGRLGFVPEPLFGWKIEETGISPSNAALQKQFAVLAYRSQAAREAGQSDAPILAEAAALASQPRPTISPRLRSARINYFVGSMLLNRRDRRCLGYLRRAVALRCWKISAWYKLAVATLLTPCWPAVIHPDIPSSDLPTMNSN